jgi:hypothetical protein
MWTNKQGELFFFMQKPWESSPRWLYGYFFNFPTFYFGGEGGQVND